MDDGNNESTVIKGKDNYVNMNGASMDENENNTKGTTKNILYISHSRNDQNLTGDCASPPQVNANSSNI